MIKVEELEFFVVQMVPLVNVLSNGYAYESRSVVSDSCNSMDYTVHGIL